MAEALRFLYCLSDETGGINRKGNCGVPVSGLLTDYVCHVIDTTSRTIAFSSDLPLRSYLANSNGRCHELLQTQRHGRLPERQSFSWARELDSQAGCMGRRHPQGFLGENRGKRS